MILIMLFGQKSRSSFIYVTENSYCINILSYKLRATSKQEDNSQNSLSLILHYISTFDLQLVTKFL